MINDPPRNAISIDVEDWQQSVLDPTLPLTDRFCESTRKVLRTLDNYRVRGTFFVLGLAAEKAPDLVREIQQAGHEIQSHGHGHRLVHTLTRDQFRQDLDRSKKLLEDITGQSIIGYRAPAFSINLKNLWALDVIVESGFEYDSSIFPVKMPRYGIAEAPRYPHHLKTPAGYQLIEVPVACYRCCGRTIPVGGGGYFRLFPYAAIRHGVNQLNREGQPATIYLHPYEYDPHGLAACAHRLSWKRRLHQGLGRRGLPSKVDRLLADFPFGSIHEQITAAPTLPSHKYLPPAHTPRSSYP